MKPLEYIAFESESVVVSSEADGKTAVCRVDKTHAVLASGAVAVSLLDASASEVDASSSPRQRLSFWLEYLGSRNTIIRWKVLQIGRAHV